jgi:hypothetical protein
MTLLAGILPFGAAFIELYYVLSSLFASRAYYAFGFVTLTAGVFGLTTAMVSILFTYFLLCAEEYRFVLVFWGEAENADRLDCADGTGAPSSQVEGAQCGCSHMDSTTGSRGCHSIQRRV